MDVPHYKLESKNSSHNVQLQSAMESLNKEETDISIIAEDGQKIEIQKSLICLYSKMLTSSLEDIPCCRDVSISLPVSFLTINNLLKVLIQGVADVDNLDELSEVIEAAKFLGIDLQNIDFDSENDEANLDKAGTDAYRLDEELEEFLQEDVKMNSLDNTIYENRQEAHNCRQCEKVFTNKSLLNQHMLTHPNDKFFKCDQCGKMFSNQFMLNDHILTHSQDKPFDCDQCGKMFHNQIKLNKHMQLTHTQEKPFDCEQCGKMYKNKHKLSRHERTHTREKPFSCDQCGKFFSRKDHQKKHEMTHTREKPFSCDQCGSRFNRRDHLKTHQNLHVSKISSLEDIWL